MRILLALGWHPRHIAGLIRSKYERDYGWGERWSHDEVSSRADFYTRVFAGLVLVGQDELQEADDDGCRLCRVPLDLPYLGILRCLTGGL